GSPKGVKGISLFVVPKFIPKDDGTPGPRNGVSCGSIEHKMGIKASATCVMNFEDAQGWLVGEMNKGMSHMFTMMNNERLAVGVQGLGLAESSYQAAVEYARERLQGRSLTGAKNPDAGADPILVHPDIRRTLLNIRAFTEGARATAMWVARGLDLRKKHPDEGLRTEADDFIQLMTPMVKALFTDFGFDATNAGMQVFGGSGYIRETGVEQYVRDARIAQIYEGTNGIQALDMVGRKMPAHFGRYLRRFFHPVQAFIEEHAEDESMADFVMPLAKAFGRLQRATGYLAEKGMKNPDEAGAAASEYLRLFGLVAMAYIWARAAKVAMAKTDGEEAGFYQAKLGTARHYMERILPQSSGLFSSIMAGSKTMMSFADDAF
ncbi:MAG: acyl-CoA dehydrogenase C-terminal domain-containing protein, partial [Rhodospirillales bacterium]|nr:acyl-CoA dehydrogenase C-terminal domain-containing protein [Rhodospirillales bacterium]